MQTSRCLRAIVGQTCVTLMASLRAISAMKPSPAIAGALIVLAIAGGALNGSLHEACKED